MDQKKIGLFLKSLRKEKALTQEQLAEQFLVSNRTVSRWETGSNIPDLDTLIVMAEFYEVDLQELLCGERKTPESAEGLPGYDTDIHPSESESHDHTCRGGAMKKNGICLVIPALLFPYFVILSLATIFFANKSSFFSAIMEGIFRGNAWYLTAALTGFALIAAGMCVIFLILALRRRWEPCFVAKVAMILKLIQIPAYIVIFILGVLFLLTVFTIPFTFALVIFDCVAILMSGLVTVSSIINARRMGMISKAEAVIFAVLQFVFVLDVISAVVLFGMLSGRRR